MNVVYGFHVIEEYIRSGNRRGMRLLIAGKGPRTKKLTELAEKKGITVASVTKAELDELCGTRDHRGLGLALEEGKDEPKTQSLESLLSQIRQNEYSLIMLLDGITDPHNLGAIIRSCDQFGVDGVVIPQRRSAKETLTVEKTSAGSTRFVKTITVPNLERSIGLLKDAGYWVLGADMAGEVLSKTTVQKKIAVVMGSEGDGMSRIVREACDSFVSIPARGHVDSFNVSVAAGIILYECRRQHGW